MLLSNFGFEISFHISNIFDYLMNNNIKDTLVLKLKRKVVEASL